MAASVSVPSSLLEDIFRLLGCLGDLGDPRSRFRKNGRGIRIEDDSVLWELKFRIGRLQSQIVETYLLTVGGVTEDEMRDLEEWVADGNSVYDNPCLLCDGSGRPMDFINASRVWLDMCLNPSDYFGDAAGGGSDDEDLPF
jgi:hypothetical protein